MSLIESSLPISSMFDDHVIPETLGKDPYPSAKAVLNDILT
jgi:hypothetical protein